MELKKEIKTEMKNTKTCLLWLLAMTVSLALPAFSYADTFYVATTGNDEHDCTEAKSQQKPKRTINAALKCLGTAEGAGAGHTVVVKDGTYVEWFHNNVPGGLSWNQPFTLRAENRRGVILRPVSGAYNVIRIARATSKYIIIDGFVIDAANVTYDAVKVTYSGPNPSNSAHHVRLQHNEIKNAPNQGILGCGVGSEILYNEIHHNGTTDFAHGIYCSSENLLVEGNTLYRNAGWGIHIYKDAGTAGPGIVVRRNLSYNNARAGNRGPGIIVGGVGTLAYSNIVWGNQGGIQVAYSGAKDIKVFNNTVFGNKKYSINIHYKSLNTEIRNNIIYGNVGPAISLAGGTVDYVSSHNLTTDPLFTNAPADFSLRSNSPAINAGMALREVKVDFLGTPRPQGAGYDIGAFEYYSGSSPGPGLDPDPDNNKDGVSLGPTKYMKTVFYPRTESSLDLSGIAEGTESLMDGHIEIFDRRGRRIKQILLTGTLSGGRAEWDGTNDQGAAVAAGVYVVVCTQGDRVVKKKVVVVK